MDLPFRCSNEHIFTPDDSKGVTVEAGSNMIIFQRAIQQKDLQQNADLLVVHRYTKFLGQPDDQYYRDREYDHYRYHDDGEDGGEDDYDENEDAESDGGYRNSSESRKDDQIKLFFAKTWYTCKITIVNTSKRGLLLKLISQVPLGAIPYNRGQINFKIFVGANRTVTMPISFYFPEAGQFLHNSSNILSDGNIIAKGGEQTLDVEATKRVVSVESF